MMDSKEEICPFCDARQAVLENELAYARYDGFPVNDGHLLLVPRRHVSDYFDTTEAEKQALQELLERGKSLLDGEKSPDGYNFGVNCGQAAGQTVMHVHVHLIPRYDGDMDDPRGGIRGVIPKKQKY